MSGLETKIARDLLKPASGLVDAVLAPKIEKIKKWAKEKDLKGELKEEKLSSMFEKYLSRFSKQVSFITTIVFPQQQIPLADIYEPLSLRDRLDNKHYDIDIKKINNGKNYVLIDSAGMGKSTYSKCLAGKILSETDLIPILLELRKIEEGDSLIDAMKDELDELDEQFSKDIFLKLIKAGKFVTILDGFDEVDIDIQKKIGKQITDLSKKGGKNTLVLTSRPQPYLPEIANCKTLQFEPLIIEQAQSLAVRYDKIANLDVGARLIKEFDKVPSKFIETPLLVTLLYRTFGFNNSIANRVSTFYDEVYDAFYKGHDLTKAGFIRIKKSTLDVEEFRRLLRAFSFMLILNKKVSLKNQSEAAVLIEKASGLCSVKPESSLAFFDDLLIAVPLMFKDGAEYRFIHKTIAEYFAAEYIVYVEDSVTLVEKIIKSHLLSTFKKSLEFLADLNPSLFRKTISAPVAQNYLDEFPVFSEANSIWQTSIYLGKLYIGMWPAKKVLEKENINLPKTPEGALGQTYYYGSAKEKEYILALSGNFRDHKNMTDLAWKDITSIKKDAKMRHLDLDFSDIVDELPIGKWLSVDNELIKDISQTSTIKGVLLGNIAMYGPQVEGYFGRSFDAFYIDHKVCEKLIQDMIDENSNKKAIEEIIDI